jgi:hypothetical protein
MFPRPLNGCEKRGYKVHISEKIMLERISIVCRSPLTALVFGVALALVSSSPQNACAASIDQALGADYLIVPAAQATTITTNGQDIHDYNHFTVISDPTARSGQALLTDCYASPPFFTVQGSTNNYATYDLQFATAGTYYLYTTEWRALDVGGAAPSGAENSFWIPNGFGVSPDNPNRFKALSNAGQGNPTTYDTYADANALSWGKEAQDLTTLSFTVTAQQVNTPLQFTIGTREYGMIVSEFVFSTNASLSRSDYQALIAPEPGALTLLTSALLGLLAYAWRKRV